MKSTFDLVLRRGLVFDGSGSEPFDADVAVPACEEIDAHGFAVTPGFVDIHTPYGSQVTWVERLVPSHLTARRPW